MDSCPLKYISLPALLVGTEKFEIIEANDQAALLTGIQIEKLLGMNGASFLPGTKIIPMDFERVIFKNASGRKQLLELGIQAFSEAEKSSYILTFYEKEHQFQELMDGSHDGVIIIDDELNVVNVNPAFCSIAELDREILVGYNAIKLVRKYIPASDSGQIIETIEKMVSGIVVEPLEIVYKEKTLHVSSRNPQKTRYFIGVVKDVSKEKKAQKAVKASEEKFRFFAESTIEGVVVHNKGIVMDANESFLKMTGYTHKEAIGKNLFDYLPDKKDQEALAASMLEKKSLLQQVRANKKDGSLFTIEIESKEVKYMDNNVRIVAVRDVTKQIALQSELKESEERYRTVFEKTGTATVIIEKDRIISLANTKFANLVGYSAQEIENKRAWMDFVLKEDISKMKSWHELRRKDPEKTPKEYEFRLMDRFKNIKYISLFVDLIPGTDKSIASLVEITERKKALVKLKESEARLKKAQSIAMMGNWSLNLNTFEASGSEETKKIYGLSGQTMTSEKIQNIHLPEYREMLDKALGELIAGKSNYDHEFKLKNQLTGQVLDVRSIAEYNAKENIVTGVIQDVSRMKHAESLNSQREQYLQSIFRAAPVGIGVVANRHFSAVNRKLCELTGYSEKELLNKPSRMLYLTESEYEYVGNVKYREIGEHGTGTVETRWKCKDETIKDILLSSTPIDTDDLLKGVTFTALDITERKKAEKDLLSKNRELILAKDKAEESDRLKTAFLANMSHEIRTPMNGIIGFTNLLANPSLTTETMLSYIEIINKSGDRLLGTVNDLIDISKLEAGLVNILIEDTSVGDLLDSLYRFFDREAVAKGIRLNYHKASSDHPLIIRTDEKKLNSILTNLVKNAIKYTNQGSVDFGFRELEGKDNSKLEFYIRDTGIGIPKDRQEAIFNRFEQADIEDHNVYEGSGLGLTIAQTLAELLGGRIWLESTEGKGTTFFFSLPFIKSEGKGPVSIDTKQVKQQREFSKKLKILIAEDDVASFLHLSILTRKLSREVLHVTSGSEAVKACREHPDIDLVLMDIKMPGMSGLEATRLIREFNSSLIIIAQTAYALHGDREKALEAGCNDHITKPILREEFMEKIGRHIGSL